MMAQIDANEANIKLRLKWVMEGLLGVVDSADVRAIIRDYCENHTLTGYDTTMTGMEIDTVEQWTDMYPTVHIWRLRQLCEAQGINLLTIMQNKWQTLGYTSIERAIMSTVVDSFQTGTGGYWVYPAINIAYLHQYKDEPNWAGNLPAYICSSHLRVDEESVPGYIVHSSTSLEAFTASGHVEELGERFVHKPTWDIVLSFNKFTATPAEPRMYGPVEQIPIDYLPISGCSCACISVYNRVECVFGSSADCYNMGDCSGSCKTCYFFSE